ncbi:MAG TPA: FAD-binding protein [Pyrinomonadaceae bacterium]|nr:FAD-binding protein [Pyrinomonadaceae bacterium]
MDTLINNLTAIVGQDAVLSRPDQLLVYECDGLPHHKYRPRAVVFPGSTEQTSAVMRELASAGVPFTPRGAGTGLSGGALALNSGVVIEMARMRKILRIDPDNRIAVVQPGVVNLQVSRAVAPYGLYYVPDPSSQPTCTIGGNIAESAGGIHCLKYGTTTDHVLGCKVVLSGGEVVELGGFGAEDYGYDLLGTFIGSEGTFGIATEATLRLVQIPPAVRTLLAEFAEVDDASHAVSAIIAAGVMPAALEMMDREIIRAVEASVFAAGLPPDAGAALLIELDGIEAGLDGEADRVTNICMEYGARNCRLARDENERKKLWAARKGAFGAIGRISPDSMIQDAVVPRSRLPEVLGAAYEIAARNKLRIANVFHAGDGNLHPLICFDSRSPEEVQRVKEAGRELMQVCVNAGGTITGEHGVGLDKRELLPLVFSDSDMEAMLSVRAAFDPLGLCNPGKVIPMLRGCGEGKAIATESTPEVEQALSAAVLPAKPISSRSGEPIAKQLESLVGPEHFWSNSSRLVVSPSSEVQVQEIIRLASHDKLLVVPCGSGTWLPDVKQKQNHLVLNTHRLNRVIEHEPADLVATAQSGVSLVTFNETLAENGQWLPLDPPDDGTATLGGVVATGVGGAQQFGYGKPRGSVIGMKVVLANGELIKAGGRVVKNVAGYDLCKLFTGSFGSLGVITELTFKLRPCPAVQTTIAATGEIALLYDAARSIVDNRLFPVAVELLSPALAQDVQSIQVDHTSLLLVRFAGNNGAVKFQQDQALSLIRPNCSSVATLENDAALWREVATIPVNQSSGWRASVLPASLPVFVETLSDMLGDGFANLRWQMSAGDGRIRVFDELPGDKQQLNQLSVMTNSFAGRLIMAQSPSQSGDGQASQQLAKRVKTKLDPAGIFPQASFR